MKLRFEAGAKPKTPEQDALVKGLPRGDEIESAKDGKDIETVLSPSEQQLESVWKKLQARGIVQTHHIPELKGDILVIDLEQLARPDEDEDLKIGISHKGVTKTFGKREVLISLLRDKTGLTVEQFKNKEHTEKPFLYIPEDADSATSMIAVKNAEFHKGIWELVTSYGSGGSSIDHPVNDEKRGSVSEIEARVAVGIFHPDYGDGLRDETGALFIRDPDTRKYKPFSMRALREYGVVQGTMRTRDASGPLQERMESLFPHLVRKGLLDPVRDVRSLSMHAAMGEERQEVQRRRVNKTGYVMINGVNHFLGRSKDLKDRDVEIRELTPTLGCLIDVETGNITHTFRIFKKEDLPPTSAGYHLAGKEKVSLTAVDATSLTRLRGEYETPDQYRARLRGVEDGLQFLLKLSARAPALQKIITEQGAGGRAVGNTARFIEGTENGENAFEVLAGQFGSGEGTAQKFFSVYSSLMEAADASEELVQSHVQMDIPPQELISIAEQVRSHILLRAQTLLTESIHGQKPEQVLKKLEGFSTDAVIFTSACRSLKDAGELDLEQMRRGSLETAQGNEISKEDRARMQEIWRARYSGKYAPPLQEKLQKEFDDSLQQEHTRFYLYRFDGTIVSYFRVDTHEPTQHGIAKKHLASFMTDPSFGGGKLGEALFEEGLKREQEGAILIGECDPEIGITEKYLDLGFVATRYYKDDGEPTFAIERREKRNLTTQLLSRSEIQKKANSREASENTLFYAGTVPPDFITRMQMGFVLTRYFKEMHDGVVRYYAAFERPSREGETSS